jgi:hypothetical protein
MKAIHTIRVIVLWALLLSSGSCDILEPEPVDLLTNDLVLNEPSDVANVEIGLYSAFRNIAPATVIAGDFTADMLIHNGTFSQYRELGTKQISSANASVATLWGAIYNTVYIANFILERLPEVSGVPTAQRNQVMGTAHFLRGYAYFIALYSFGGVPEVVTTDIETNRNIPRASEADMLDLILDDYNEALATVPEIPQRRLCRRVRRDRAPAFTSISTLTEAEAFSTEELTRNSLSWKPNSQHW